ncbi:MAG: hypothetical protein K2H82_02220 [Oscillospiraceae bacterium]|nr:hypothetical protein [Oscillospiraceae bacterium]
MNENQVFQQNPFAGQKNSLNAGTVTIESSRAVAETQSKILLAKRFPRNEAEAYEKAMTACSRISFAEKALYSYPRSEQTISGASIRLAEELARCWGNLDYGIKELSQKAGESEMMAYCWDMENNLISSQTFVVEHARDTRKGKQKLTTQRDIYENNANMAGRRLRARILAVLPPDLVEAAVEACRQTLTVNKVKPTPQQIAETKQVFSELGVNLAAIENRIGHSLNDLTMQELNDFYGIYGSIMDGHSSVSDWFDVKTNAGRAKSLTDKIMNGNHQNGEQLVMTATE